MLSESWENQYQDKNRRANLFKDLSRIMLSLGRVPLPRIGSFTINDEGILSLTNRPLTLQPVLGLVSHTLDGANSRIVVVGGPLTT
jgi:hypothetical protein